MLKRSLILILTAALLFGAGTVTQTNVLNHGGTQVYSVTLTVTADAVDASVPAYVIRQTGAPGGSLAGMSIVAVVTDPGATAPTDNWDLTITDSREMDLMQGACLNRDTVTTETCSANPIPIIGTITLNVTGNSVNSATITIVVYFTRQTVAKRGGSGGGDVASVFGRIGAVSAQAGDYSIGDITGAGTSAALDVGTAPGTVAAGDDSRFPTADQKSALDAASSPSGSNPFATSSQVWHIGTYNDCAQLAAIVTNPAVGFTRFYCADDGSLRWRTSDGVEQSIGGPPPTVLPLFDGDGSNTWSFKTVTALGANRNWIYPDTTFGDDAIPALEVSGTDHTVRAATHADVTKMYGSGSCAGYLKSDGTCDTPSGGASTTFQEFPFDGALSITSTANAMGVADRTYVQRIKFDRTLTSPTAWYFNIVTGSASSTWYWGLYSIDGNTRILNCSGSGASATTITCTTGLATVAAGDYWMAQAASDTTTACAISASPGTGMAETASMRGWAANPVSGGSLPTTLGAITYIAAQQEGPCKSVLATF